MTIQIESNQIQDNAVVASKIVAGAISGTKIANDSVDSQHINGGALDAEHFSAACIAEAALQNSAVAYAKIKSSDIETSLVGGASKLATAAAIKAYVDGSAAGLEILDDVADIVNAASAPPSTGNGDRYIIGDSSSPHTGWGSLTFANGDVLEYNGSAWTLAVDVSVEAADKTLLVWNYTDGIWNKLSVGSTTWTEHGGLAGVTAGSALTKTSNTLDVNVDNSTIEVSGDALRVADAGITAQKLAGSIPADKIQLGHGVQESGGQLTLLLNGSTLTNGAGGLKIADAQISATQLANNAITTVKIGDAQVTPQKLASNIPADKLQLGNGVQESEGELTLLLDGGTLSNSTSGLKVAAGQIGTTQLATDAVTADKVGFSSNWDNLSPNGSLTSFDLSDTVNECFASLIVIRNGMIQKQVSSSPSDDSEYSVSLTGGAGGVTRITFGSAPANGSDLRVWYMA